MKTLICRKGLEFGVFDRKDVGQQSVLELCQRNLYEQGNVRRQKAAFGALDDRMGVATKDSLCGTCGMALKDCVGHFGSIQLALPVFHIGYFRMVIHILQAICKTCSRVMIPEDSRRVYLKRMRNPQIDYIQKHYIFKSVHSEAKKYSVCPYCKAKNGTVKKVSALKVEHQRFKSKTVKVPEFVEQFHETFSEAIKDDASLTAFVQNQQEPLDPLTVYRLFERVSDEDVEVLGLDSSTGRPEKFLWTAMPIPPVAIRPTVQKEDGENADDITVLISEIIDTNTKLRVFIDNGQSVQLVRDHWEFLQLQCAMYINCDLPGVSPAVAKNIQKIKKGFVQRLKGKQGRFRGNLSGKRVDFSARTVISPDPNMRVDQVAVPERMAKILTYSERVTVHNLDRLKNCVRNGPNTWPGAIFVQKKHNLNQKFLLKSQFLNKNADNLQVGDVVFRHLRDGDIVLFNRQPSLHKLSIMAHRAKVMPWRTLRFNECVCTPYNADFDGDEMNLHLPQVEEARAEALELMSVKQNLVTPRDGSMLVSATQDFITCSYLLTRKDVFYDRSETIQICTYFTDGLLHIDLPPPCIQKPVRLWSGKQIYSLLLKPNKSDRVKVCLEGKTKSFSKPKDGRIPVMCPYDGYATVINSEILSGIVDKSMIGDSKGSIFYAVLRDFGSDAAAECMNRLAKLSARFMGNQGFSIGINDVQPGEKLQRIKEDKVKVGFSDCDELIALSKVNKLQKQAGMTLDETFEARLGGVLSKIREELGDTCLRELSPHNAPLIMSVCGSKGSKLNVCQMVACVGQQIISGQRIPNGFIDRSLPHFPSNSKLPMAKGFVKSSFYTGLQPCEFFFHAVSGREGLVDTAVKTAETGYMQRRLMKALEDLTVHYDTTVRNSVDSVIQFVYGRDGLDPVLMESEQTELFPDGRQVQRMFPICLERQWLRVQHSESTDDAVDFLSSDEIRSVTEALLQGLNWSKMEGGDEKNVEWVKLQIKEFVNREIADPLERSVAKYGKNGAPLKVYRSELQSFLNVCFEKYLRSLLEAGSAIGAVCGQSLGEPGTQMTLKTFHFAGLASANITMGVPRIKEVINASAKIATPIVTVFLDNDSSESFARVVKGRLEKTLLKDVSSQFRSVIGAKECFIEFTVDMGVVNKLALDLTCDDIADSISSSPKLKLDRDLVSVKSKNRIRIMVPSDNKTSSDAFFSLQVLQRLLPNVVVAGISTIQRAIIEKFSDPLTGNEKFKLVVEGYGFQECLCTRGVYWKRSRSNHILDIQKFLGIEAARTAIIDEILIVMSSHGISLDERHVALLSDLMTFKGTVLGITRNGIAKMRDSVLMLASFEKTTDHLFEAAFFNKKDPILGVSESIIVGNPMNVGTGLVKLLQRIDMPSTESKSLLFDQSCYHIPLQAC